MISITVTNDMLRSIVSIEEARLYFSGRKIPAPLSARLRKNSKKKRTYSSNAIEGNPLTEDQVNNAVESRKRHHLKPEEEVRNYYAALTLLDTRLKAKEPFTKKLILETQRVVVQGESREKQGLRGPMPPGVLFAVYDSQTGEAEYIPPDAAEVESLLDELIDYVNTSDDHPLIKSGIIHYQLVTIHPFEDGNGRTARLMSGYFLDLHGYDFGGIGALEEYFAYNADEYYQSLQMSLPALYYDGRDNPPHPEIWMTYFLRMVELYAARTQELVEISTGKALSVALSHLKPRERKFYFYLIENDVTEFAPIEMAEPFGVSSRTIINWCAALSGCGLLEPQLVKERIRTYKVIDLRGM